MLKRAFIVYIVSDMTLCFSYVIVLYKKFSHGFLLCFESAVKNKFEAMSMTWLIYLNHKIQKN